MEPLDFTAMLKPPTHRAAVALTVGALDPRGTDGVAVDLRTFAALAVHGSAVATAIRPLTALPERLVLDQLERALAGDLDAVKLGDCGDDRRAFALAEALRERAAGRVVLDPDLVDADGEARHPRAMLEAMRLVVFRAAHVAVVNAAEAALLTDREVHAPDAMREAAKRLFDLGPRWVVITGGRVEGHAVDLVYDGHAFTELGTDRLRKPKLRGQGTVFAAALCAGLARGLDVLPAADAAKQAVTGAIEGALQIGRHLQVDPLAACHDALGVDRQPVALPEARG